MPGVLRGLFDKKEAPRLSTPSSLIVPPEQLKSLVAGRQLTMDDFQLRSTVGTGTFGRVRVVKLAGCSDRSPFALKIMKKSEIIRLKQVEHVRSEKDILSHIQHPFIVNLIATFQDEKRLFMLMEYVNGGELFSFLRREGRLSFECSRVYAAEIVLAFEYLHSMNIIYRDLKPENLLIDAEGHIKITDFGFAKVVPDRTWTLCGTPEYLAPEIIQSKGHGKSVDWWALGILIFEMIAGYPPFYDESPFVIYQKVQEGVIEFPRHFDARAKDIVSGLLTVDRSKRLGCLKDAAEDVKKNHFFEGVDWELAANRGLQPVYIPKVRAPDDVMLFDRYPESAESSAPIISPQEQAAYFDNF